jgi:hypothetical protein
VVRTRGVFNRAQQRGGDASFLQAHHIGLEVGQGLDPVLRPTSQVSGRETDAPSLSKTPSKEQSAKELGAAAETRFSQRPRLPSRVDFNRAPSRATRRPLGGPLRPSPGRGGSSKKLKPLHDAIELRICGSLGSLYLGQRSLL